MFTSIFDAVTLGRTAREIPKEMLRVPRSQMAWLGHVLLAAAEKLLPEKSNEILICVRRADDLKPGKIRIVIESCE